MYLLSRPSDNFIERFVARQRESQLTYDEIGFSRDSRCPVGFSQNRRHAVIGNGEQAFSQAKSALLGLQMLNLGWIHVVSSSGSIQQGGLICTLIRTFGVYSLNAAKIVYVDGGESAQHFGFGYGTLPEYPISGEERFSVTFEPETQDVSYEIFSFSRVTSFLAKIGRPLVHRAQQRFCLDSIAMMKAACQQ